MSILHPVNGAVVEDDLDTLREAEAETGKRIRDLYTFRDKLRERIAELTITPAMPRPRYRTDVQAKVAACPRCALKS